MPVDANNHEIFSHLANPGPAANSTSKLVPLTIRVPLFHPKKAAVGCRTSTRKP
jgi:hypothetical protein